MKKRLLFGAFLIIGKFSIMAQSEYLPKIKVILNHLDSTYWTKMHSQNCETALLGFTPFVITTFDKIDENVRVVAGAGFSNHCCKIEVGSKINGDVLFKESTKIIVFSQTQKPFGEVIIEQSEGVLMAEVFINSKVYTKAKVLLCKSANFSLFTPYPYIEVITLLN
jgi:hypothetical protein